MIMRLVALARLVNMPHLDKAVIRIAVKLRRRFSPAPELRHPGSVGRGGRKQLLHQGFYLKGQLRVFAVAPNRSQLGNITFKRTVLPCLLQSHRPLLLLRLPLTFSSRERPEFCPG
jgi:hypothetical protein